MSGIKVPYMPISSFDASEVCKNFAEASEADEKEQNQYLMTILNDEDSREKFSEEILFILIGMGMEKYIDNFKKERILLDTFIRLNETDLQELGITDPKDREVIYKNLSIHQTNLDNFTVKENHVQDLKIIKNIYNQLLMMQNYCAYVELQMKKHKLTDYRIEKEESACMYLKAFAKAAFIQSQKLNQAIYDAQDSLVDRILKAYNLVLPNYLQKLLPKKKKKQKQKLCIFKLMTVIGFSSAVILSVKYFLSRT